MTLIPVLERLEALDIAALGPGGVALGLADVTRLERYVASVKVRLAARAAALAAEGHGAPADEALRRGCRSSSKEAAKVERCAKTATANPALGEALADGSVGLEHVDAYRGVERTLSEDQQARLREHQPRLLADAGLQTPEQFRRAVGAAAREIRDDDGETRTAQQRNDRRANVGLRDDGMGFLHALWDPETASRVHAFITAERDRILAGDPTLSFEQATADAVANLIISQGRAAHPGRVEVVAFIDLDSLLHGAHTGGVSYLSSGAEVPVSTIRRLCCDAHIIPMVLNGQGMPLDVGRAQRLANREQRRALRKLYTTCCFPGCEVRFDDCEIHHVNPWEQLGPSDLINFVPACRRHHHLIHEGGWHLTIDARRTTTVHRPDGTHHTTTPWTPPAGEHPTPRTAPPGTGATSPGAGTGPPGTAPPGSLFESSVA